MSNSFGVLNIIIMISLVSLFFMQLSQYIKTNKKHDIKTHKILYYIPNSGATKTLSMVFPILIIVSFIMPLLNGEVNIYRVAFSIFMLFYSVFMYMTLDMNLVITASGIGVKPSFLNIYLQFIDWKDIVQWGLKKDKKDNDIFFLQFKHKGTNSGLERKVKDHKDELNKLMSKYAPRKSKMIK
ncbi:hypothetical protein KPL28_12165 [Clostridium algidicarnis]|uniref:hypothetical protein n=1 Tax=Clostridium algidicarnis TaxID=37659 RepID=UPI001C0D83E7|nr:hypothetical protein [Clostridium algidicarnis]MBU3210375.1 hypothetical protein [Clostridium algidicarnis]